MKTLLILFALACTVCTGCTNLGNLQKFLNKLPATDVGDAKQEFNSPLWSQSITANDVSVDDSGLLDVGAVEAILTIPMSGVVSKISISKFRQIPTAKQRAEAAAVAAARKAASAKAAAERAEAKAKAAAETAEKVPASP